MRKEVFGLTRKELMFAAIFVASSLALIIYSSLKLIHNHYTNTNKVQSEIHSQSKSLAYLNDLNNYALNTQRSSVNILVYRTNSKEALSFKKSIESNRDSVLLKLNRIDDANLVLTDKKIDILNAGLTYLKTNTVFLQKLNEGVSTDSLSTFNLEKMRPAIRLFTDLIRKNSQTIVEKIQDTNSNRTSIFNQLEFWLLLIGLAPYLYFFYRIIALILRMILWEISS
ncbi:MAG TPA: hypothetical protein VK835_00880 [Bacteroidia bacterium]|nr:hypothetical protein [Bacteroidia bacterium]